MTTQNIQAHGRNRSILKFVIGISNNGAAITNQMFFVRIIEEFADFEFGAVRTLNGEPRYCVDELFGIEAESNHSRVV